MQKHIKQYALVVLATWLMSWAIVIYEPCCESVLDESQHNKEHQARHDHADNHHVEAGSHHESVHDCRVAVENIDDLTAPISDFYSVKYEKNDILLNHNTDYSLQLANTALTPSTYHYTHPPPKQKPIFFSTQRFRI